jgi:hypothetical protein
MKKIKYTILYCVFVRSFVIPFYYGSGSDFLKSYGSGSTQQKVTVPTVSVPVPQHWETERVLGSTLLTGLSLRSSTRSTGWLPQSPGTHVHE